MSKLHFVKRARKSIRGSGIKKGDPYYYWIMPPSRNGRKRVRGRKMVSKTRPPRSAYLTTSPFLKTMMDLEDNLTRENIDDTIAALEELKDECNSSLENMRDAWPNGCPTIDLLEARVEACETIAEELEAAKYDGDDEVPDGGEENGDGEDSSKDGPDTREICVNWQYE